MKAFISLMFLSLVATPALAESGPATLFSGSGGSDLGVYLGLGAKSARVDGQTTVLSGGELALLVGHGFAVGVGGWGSAAELDGEAVTGHPDDGLRFGYGGLQLRYHLLASKSPVALGFGALIGAGGVEAGPQVSQWDEEHDHDGHDKVNNDVIFAAEPEVSVALTLTSWARLMATASYRVVRGVQSGSLDNGDFSGLGAGLQLHLGWL